MRMLTALVFAGLLSTCLSEAAGAQIWFDLASGEPTVVTSVGDSQSTLTFPPYPFGDVWPPGTLVYIEFFTTDVLPPFAANYASYFNDGGCGCAGLPVETITYRFHYDESQLEWPESETTLYVSYGSPWTRATNVQLDTLSDTITYSYFGIMPTLVNFGIGPSRSVPTATQSWGQLKQNYLQEHR